MDYRVINKVENINNMFELIHVVSKRTKQLNMGSPLTIEVEDKSTKKSLIALQEVIANKELYDSLLLEIANEKHDDAESEDIHKDDNADKYDLF